MEDKNKSAALDTPPGFERTSSEQTAVDQFVVEWQIPGNDCAFQDRRQIRGKPIEEEFIADWSIITPTILGRRVAVELHGGESYLSRAEKLFEPPPFPPTGEGSILD